MSDLVPLAPGIMLHTSRREHMNSVVLASISEAMVIDPGWESDELEDIASQLSDRGLRVISGVATHAHHDHVLWHPALGSAPRFASRATCTLTLAHRDSMLGALKHDLGELEPWMQDTLGRLTPVPHAPASEYMAWLPKGAAPDGFSPELVVHDGHIAGHTALWIPEARVLISGDMLSNIELPLPDLDDASRNAALIGHREGKGQASAAHTTQAWRTVDPIADYLAALDTLEPYAEKARVVIPGHGTLGTDALARLHRDRAYLEALRRGEDPDDSRRDNPGMEEWHQKLRVAA